MGTEVKRLVLSGYYGFGNSGDEAVLQSILLALKEQGERRGIRFVPVVLSIDPAETTRLYGVEAVHRMRPKAVWSAIRESDGLISGGGSLLQDETSMKTIPYYLAVIKLAQWLNKPTFIYSQGVGPIHRQAFYRWIRTVFKQARLISVRDVESAQLVQRIGIPEDRITVVPDPVMGLPLNNSDGQQPQTEERAANHLVGVSVRYWNKDRTDLNAIAGSLQQLLDKTDAEIRFLPFHLPSDEEASLYVMERLGGAYSHRISLASGIVHPQQMLAEVSGCRVLLGMRLHSLIYAAGQYVPMIGISYDPKIDHFLNRIGLKAASSTKAPDEEQIAAQLLYWYSASSSWRALKQAVTDRLKSEAQQPAEIIAAYYAKGRDVQ